MRARARALSPMSAMYKQLPVVQFAAETSSQSRVSTGRRIRPRTLPDVSSANSTVALPESLCDHSSPVVRRLIARPLASGSSGSITGPLATAQGPAPVPGRDTSATRKRAPTTNADDSPSFHTPLLIVPAIRLRAVVCADADKLTRHAEGWFHRARSYGLGNGPPDSVRWPRAGGV